MSTVEEMRKKRFQFLRLLYEQSGGDKFNRINMWDLGKKLEFTREETERVTQYLSGESLLEYATIGGGIAITHFGVREMENAISHPEQPTHYFPPINIINIHHMEGSQIQQGVMGSTQTGSFEFENRDDVANFLRLLKATLPQLQLNKIDEMEMNSDDLTLEAQLSSSRPKPGIVKSLCYQSKESLRG